MSIFLTIRFSIALSFRSGMYVELTATFCSADPWSRSFRRIVKTVLDVLEDTGV
jgi:hypothetical protein